VDSQAHHQQRNIPRAHSATQVTQGFLQCREARVTLLVLLGLWFAVIVWGSRDGWAPLVAVVGFCIWYLIEIPVHRYFLHMPIPQNARLHSLVRRLHYAHHERPADPGLLFLPEWVTLPNLIIVPAIAYAIGYLPEGLWYLAGYWTSLTVYEWMHYAAHSAWQPSWGPLHRTLQDHLRHHFHNDSYWFGVSNRFMDRIWRTSPSPERIERSTPLRARRSH
jgi:hypothetical protein